MSNLVMDFNNNSQQQQIKKMNELKLKCENIITTWLGNTNEKYMQINQAPSKWPYMPYISKKTNENNEEKIDEKINIFTQFYIDNNKERAQEIINCLILNLHNKSVDKIYLLNEKIYKVKDLGILGQHPNVINKTIFNLPCMLESFLSSPSACRTSGASKNQDWSRLFC